MIALIPARGGSKGLPGKNIKNLNGKPLIAYTIEAAKKSKSITEVIVTTDDIDIAKISEQCGASVPFIRPDYLSTDQSSAVDVYLHAIEHLISKKLNVEKFIVLQPTSPLRTEKHIDEAVELFNKENATTLVSVCEAEVPPSWYYKLNSKHRLVSMGFDKKNEILNRQHNEKLYRPNGAIYILDFEALKKHRTYYFQNTIPYIMEAEVSVDIDHIIDFEIAEFLIKRN